MMAVLLIGAYLVTYGELRIGDIVTFIGFAALLISRLDQISAFINQVSDARARLEDFFRLEASFIETKEPDGARDIVNVTGHVRFEDVSFAFPNSGHGVSNIAFEVNAGETVAIVGPTGAGKTTLINLLQRVFDPTEGRILIDGIDTRTVSRRSLRQSIATVFQDAGLFNRSIEQNIRIGCAEASYDEVHAAAEAASAHDFILTKSAGYDFDRRRTRRAAFRRRAPAHRACPRDPEKRADPGARRGDQRARRRNGGARQAGDRPASAGPHHLHHRAPADDRARRRPHHLHG